MEKRKPGWLPRQREAVLEMARTWVSYLTPERAAAWGVSAAELTELSGLAAAAGAALGDATGPDRGPAATEACKLAFRALENAMKRLKRRRFFIDPLSGDDFTALLLSPPAKTRSKILRPDEAPPLRLDRGGFMQVIIRHGPRGKGITGAVFRYAILGLADPAPTHAALTEARLLTRPLERLTFPDAEKGRVLYGSLAWLNSAGEEGPPSAVVSIVLG